MSLINEKSMNFRKMGLNAKLLTIFPDEASVVTQITSRATGVTLDATAGQITTDDSSLAAGAEAVFVVTNKYCTAKSVPVLAAASGQTAGTSIVTVTAVADGSFSITLTNIHASTADTGPMVINFALIDVN